MAKVVILFFNQSSMGKHFTMGEMVASSTADRLAIDNRLPKAYVGNVQGLIDQVLDPLREWYGRPIFVNSGYRCEALNKAVGGVEGSYHLTGCAADIDARDRRENEKLFAFIRAHLPFTELGWEGGGKWVHVALVPGREGEKEVFYA